MVRNRFVADFFAARGHVYHYVDVHDVGPGPIRDEPLSEQLEHLAFAHAALADEYEHHAAIDHAAILSV